MKTVDCSTLGVLIANHEAVDLIDIRPKRDFSATHIPGARSLPFAKLATPNVFQGRHQSARPIYVVSDDRITASLATGILTASGYVNAMVVDGGMNAWRAQGLPVRRDLSSSQLSSLFKAAAGLLMIVAGICVERFQILIAILALIGAAALFLKLIFLKRFEHGKAFETAVGSCPA